MSLRHGWRRVLAPHFEQAHWQVESRPDRAVAIDELNAGMTAMAPGQLDRLSVRPAHADCLAELPPSAHAPSTPGGYDSKHGRQQARPNGFSGCGASAASGCLGQWRAEARIPAASVRHACSSATHPLGEARVRGSGEWPCWKPARLRQTSRATGGRSRDPGATVERAEMAAASWTPGSVPRSPDKQQALCLRLPPDVTVCHTIGRDSRGHSRHHDQLCPD